VDTYSRMSFLPSPQVVPPQTQLGQTCLCRHDTRAPSSWGQHPVWICPLRDSPLSTQTLRHSLPACRARLSTSATPRRLDGTNPLSSAHTYGRAGAAPSPLRLRRSRVPCAVGGGLGGGPAPPRQLQQPAQRRPAAVAAVSTAPPQSPSAGSPPQKWRLDGGPGVHVAGVGGG
jgi:hypothetical protein